MGDYALFTGQTTVWEGIPPIVSFIIFLILMSVVGMLEGMQIAFFACAKLRAEERGTSKIAKMTAKLLFKGDGNNLPGFHWASANCGILYVFRCTCNQC